jgi:hypothetical protein
MSSPAAPGGKPPGLTTAIAIAIVLAAFDGLSTLWGLAGHTTVEQMRDTITARLPSGLSAHAGEQLARVQARMMELVDQRLAMAMAVITLPVAIWVVVAAIRLKQGKRGAVPWFSRAMVALAAIEVVHLAHAIYMQRAMRPFMTELIDIGMPVNKDAAKMMETMRSFLELVLIGGLLFGVAVAAAKVFACLYARHCARQPAVRAWTGELRNPPA